MWDVNPQSHAFYLRDIDRHFTATATARQFDSQGRSWKVRVMQRLSTVATQGAVAGVAFCVVAGLILG